MKRHTVAKSLGPDFLSSITAEDPHETYGRISAKQRATHRPTIGDSVALGGTVLPNGIPLGP